MIREKASSQHDLAYHKCCPQQGRSLLQFFFFFFLSSPTCLCNQHIVGCVHLSLTPLILFLIPLWPNLTGDKPETVYLLQPHSILKEEKLLVLPFSLFSISFASGNSFFTLRNSCRSVLGNPFFW